MNALLIFTKISSLTYLDSGFLLVLRKESFGFGYLFCSIVKEEESG